MSVVSPAQRRALSALAIFCVTAAIGVLFGISASNARARGWTDEMNLAGLVKDQQRMVTEIQDEVEALQVDQDVLLNALLPDSEETTYQSWLRSEIVGPGLTVSLDDAPVDFQLDDNTNVNVAVVHQQDVDAVMNALWRGGAEALSVQGIRITATTPVRCVGNVILVGSKSFAPPYRITAIGDTEGMTAALDNDPSVSLYREDAARYQLGWSVQTSDNLTIPATVEFTPLKFVTPTEGT